MMTRDERLRYLEKLEEAESAILSDPEVAVEYAEARLSWDTAISPGGTEAEPEGQKASQPGAELRLS